MGTSHGVVLDDALILAELDARDIEYLHRIDTLEKQEWAELLAFRLAKEWRPVSEKSKYPRRRTAKRAKRVEAAPDMNVTRGNKVRSSDQGSLKGHGTG